jgi:hypothetical protein
MMTEENSNLRTQEDINDYNLDQNNSSIDQ